MNNSSLFKQAHAMAKATHKQGENYQVTFGACLKLIKAQQAKAELVAIEQATTSKENESSFWVYLAACLLIVLAMPAFNLNGYSILAGCSVCILGYVFEPLILAKLDSFKAIKQKPCIRVEPVIFC